MQVIASNTINLPAVMLLNDLLLLKSSSDINDLSYIVIIWVKINSLLADLSRLQCTLIYAIVEIAIQHLLSIIK